MFVLEVIVAFNLFKVPQHVTEPVLHMCMSNVGQRAIYPWASHNKVSDKNMKMNEYLAPVNPQCYPESVRDGLISALSCHRADISWV